MEIYQSVKPSSPLDFSNSRRSLDQKIVPNKINAKHKSKMTEGFKLVPVFSVIEKKSAN